MSEPVAAVEQVPQSISCGLVHDLRSPLNIILGYSEILIEQLHEAGHDEFIPNLEKIRIAGNQLLAVIEDNFQSD